MSYLPQANALLLAVLSPGATEDYDVAAGSGASKWTGAADAYYDDKIRTVYSANDGSLSKLRDVQMVIPADLTDSSGSPVSIYAGDSVTYQVSGTQHTRRITDYVSKPALGTGYQLPTIRLHLDAQPLEAG